MCRGWAHGWKECTGCSGCCSPSALLISSIAHKPVQVPGRSHQEAADLLMQQMVEVCGPSVAANPQLILVRGCAAGWPAVPLQLGLAQCVLTQLAGAGARSHTHQWGCVCARQPPLAQLRSQAPTLASSPPTGVLLWPAHARGLLPLPHTHGRDPGHGAAVERHPGGAGRGLRALWPHRAAVWAVAVLVCAPLAALGLMCGRSMDHQGS